MDRAQRSDGVVATVVVDRYRGDLRRVRERRHLRTTASLFVEQARRLGFGAPPLGVASADGGSAAPLSAGREQIRELVARLRRQAVDRRILYWTGHGEVVGDSFYLACEDSYEDGRFDPARAVSAEELVSWLAEDARDTLLVLDACFAGEAVRGLGALVERARERVESSHADAGFAFVATAGSEQEAMEGHWVECLEQVLSTPELVLADGTRLFHREDGIVVFPHLMFAVNDRTRGQTPIARELRPLSPGFLLNPYWSLRARSALRPEDDESWIGKEFRSEELPVFSDSGDSWHLRDFASRERVLGELVDWLRVRESGMFAVTGASGAGKSTLLAYVAQLTVESFVTALPADRRPRARPELRSVNAVLHCRGKTLAGLCDELAESLRPMGLAVDGGGSSPLTYVEEVRKLAERKGSLTLLFDGLDEAAAGHSFPIARALLNRLAAQPRVRVVVATRRNTRRNLPGDLPVEGLLDVLHCMEPLELDRTPEVVQDIAGHVERLLREEDSPYNRLPEAEQTRAAVARHIAARSNGLFLVATLWARSLTQLPTVPDADRLDRELRRSTAVLDSLLAEELDRLDPQDPDRIRDFMRALALAQGVGLPQPRVWLAVTNAVRGPDSREYDGEDLRRVMRAATGVAITKADEFGAEVYHLHHPSFGAHLLGGEAAQRQQHRAVHRALTPGAHETWQDAEPYVAHYLAAHAVLAGDDALQELVADHHFLVAAAPEILEPLVAARLATDRQGALYLSVADHFRRHPSSEVRSRWTMLRATALAMFSSEGLQAVPKPSFMFWDDVWSSAERLPLRRSLPAPTGGALAVHWETEGDGLIHVSGAGEIRSWTADGRETRSRTTGPATWASPPAQRGVTVAGSGESRVIAAHDSQCVRMWHGRGRTPVEELYWGGAPSGLGSVRLGAEVFLAAVDESRLWVWRWNSTAEYSRKRLVTYHDVVPGTSCVAVAAWGERVAVVTGGPTVTVWEAQRLKTGQPKLLRARTLHDGSSVVKAVAVVAPSGESPALIAALDGHALRVWRLDDLFGGESELRLRTGSAGRAVALGQGPQGLLTAVREEDTVRVWDGSGREYVPLPCEHHHDSLAFDPSGTGRLAVADDTRLQVWEPHGGDALAVPVRGNVADNPQLRVTAGPDGTMLLARSQGCDVLLSLHAGAGRVVDGPRLPHTWQVTALAATRAGDGWLTAAVGRRRVLLWRLGPRLELLDTEELELPGASDQGVPSLDLSVTATGRTRLMWPLRQEVITWERDGFDRGEWREGRSFVLTAAGSVQRLEVVEAPDASWLSLRGGDAVRVWNLARPDAPPERVTCHGATAVATGALRRAVLTAPLVAYATKYTVEIRECNGGIDVPTLLPEQPGGPLGGLTLAGPRSVPCSSAGAGTPAGCGSGT